MATVVIELPNDLFASSGETPEEFVRRMRLAAAAKWYDMGLISQGRAAELAGVSRAEFIDALGPLGISVFQYGPEELEREARS